MALAAEVLRLLNREAMFAQGTRKDPPPPPPPRLKKKQRDFLRVAAITREETTTLNPNVSGDVEKLYQHVCMFKKQTNRKPRLANVYCDVIALKEKSISRSQTMEPVIACLPATRVRFFQICTLTFGRPVPEFPFYSST